MRSTRRGFVGKRSGFPQKPDASAFRLIVFRQSLDLAFATLLEIGHSAEGAEDSSNQPVARQSLIWATLWSMTAFK